MITIRRAETKDIPKIMQFMEEHWLHNYALAHDRNLFNWQFVHNDKVNVWIGIDDTQDKLYAMFATIFYTNTPHPDMSGSVWLAIKSSNPMLAYDIQNLMWAEIQPRDSFSPGLRPDAIRINKILGNTIVAMDHYYRLRDIDNYKIAVIKDKNIPPIQDTGYSIQPIADVKEMQLIIPEDELLNSAPRKDYLYIIWRYFKHPIFHYDIWKILDNTQNPCAILVTREENANCAKSCKIVDFYGDSEILSFVSPALDNLMQEKGYEFVDVYSYGVPSEIYEKTGMLRCTKDSQNIIPNFFQPYTPVNSDIFLVPPSTPGTRLFRGDSDQDKPRLIPNL